MPSNTTSALRSKAPKQHRKDAPLTQRQETFCVAYVTCSNASEAYRLAFQAPNAQPKTIHERASRLMANSKVLARIETLRAPVREEAQLTLQAHLASLEAIRDKAIAKEQFGSAVSAEIARGKASGFYTDRHEITLNDIHEIPTLSNEELDKRLKAAKLT